MQVIFCTIIDLQLVCFDHLFIYKLPIKYGKNVENNRHFSIQIWQISQIIF